MLARVEFLSRLGPQFVEKSMFPNGFEEAGKLDLCGMEPARNRDKRAALVELVASSLEGASAAKVVGGLKGLVDGVGREVLESRDCDPVAPLTEPTGENFEGTVPALALLEGLLKPASVVATRSGKPSWVGDSGIFSHRGVEFPLAVGGPRCWARALPEPAALLYVWERVGH